MRQHASLRSSLADAGRLHLHQPKKERIEEEPLMAAATRRQQLLWSADDPEDSPDYLKALWDSMSHHSAWVAPVNIGIEQSMHDSGPFIDLTGGEGTSDGAGPSHVKEEEGEEEE
jgi:hypothetical protein